MNKKYALLSVFYKTGIVEFARELVVLGWTILSSAGTFEFLRKAGIPVTNVSELTGQEPILDHRVATLHPEIHGGLLAAEEMIEELERLGYPWIDLVCVDMYPLKYAIAKPGATAADVLKATDIGGPTLLRSGGKGRRIVICDPSDRAVVLTALQDGSADAPEYRAALAAKADAVIADYCLASARYTSWNGYDGLVGRRVAECVYGENAWQAFAGLYEEIGTDDPLALSQFKLVEGTPPSYNNWCDVDRLLQTVTHIAAGFSENIDSVPNIAVGAKHGNPCGAAVSDSPNVAIERALAGDPRAIFGGFVMLNAAVDDLAAQQLIHHGMAAGKRRLLDGVVAPSFSDGAVELLARKEGKCRLLSNPALGMLSAKSLDVHPRLRYVRGGFLLQPNYTHVPHIAQMKHDLQSPLTAGTETDAILAWAICATSNSNTITLVKEGMLIGNGVGQQDRVSAAQLAVKRARDSKHSLTGSVAWSDSFFPFPDGVEVLAEAGIRHIFTTTGSINDGKVIEACLNAGVSISRLPDAEARAFYGH